MGLEGFFITELTSYVQRLLSMFVACLFCPFLNDRFAGSPELL